MRRRSILGTVITDYGNWEITISATPTTIDNTGGIVTLSSQASRIVYWSDKSTTMEYGTPTMSVSSGTLSGNKLTLGANTSTSVKTITITALYEGFSKLLNISLAGKTIKSYSDWTVTVSANPSSGISAAGGTSTITRNASRIATWTDDSTTTETATPTLSTNLGSISGNTLTLEPNQTTSARSATITATHSGKSATCTVSLNADTIAAYGDVNLTVGTIADVPAKGGSSTSTGSSATQVLTWTSGRTTTAYPIVTEGSISNIASKGTTTSDRTSLGNVTITATGLGSKTASKTLTVYLQANLPSYGAISISSHGSAGDIAASGGDKTASGGSGTLTVTYTSGSTRAGTVTCGTYSKVSANSLGTTEKVRTHIGNSTATLTGEGSKTTTVSVAVYQQANVKTLSSISAWASYSSNKPSSSNQNNWLAAGGGYIDGYCQANYSYTSGSTSTANVTSSTTWTSQGNYGSISGNRFTVPSRETTAGTDRYNCIYASYGGKSASFDTGNEKNEIINSNYNPYISTYGTPSVSIGSGITAKGDSATVSHSVSNTQTYYQLYTSGSTTTHTRSVTGTTTIKIQSNGNNRFSLSGNTLSHSSMGTSATTDTCTIRATNSGDTSKVKDTNVSVTNAITSYGNVSVSSHGSASDIPAKGGTIKGSGGTGSLTITYTSGSTRAGTVTCGSYSEVSASSLSTTLKERTKIGDSKATLTGEGSKTASVTVAVYQLANTRSATSTSGGVTTYGNVTAGAITNATIPASGGSAKATAGNGSLTWSTSKIDTTYTYTSGSTKTETTTAAKSGTNTISPSVASYTASADSKSTTTSDTTTVGSKAVTWSGSGGKSASGTMYVYQSANTRWVSSIYLVPYQPDSSWITTVTNGNWNTVPASGGYLKSYGYYRYTYSSGSTKDELASYDAPLSWNTGYNSWITSHSNGGYYVHSRGATTGDARSATGTWSAAGFTATKTFTQAANALTNTSYGSWSYNWVGTGNSTRSRSITYTYTSGSTSSSTGSETGGTRYIVLDNFSDKVAEGGTHSFGAAGGSITARTVSHEYWGSTYITMTVITGVSVSCTGFTCSVSGSTVTMSASNLGTTVTAAKSGTLTSTKSGFTTRLYGTLSQAANTQTLSSISAWASYSSNKPSTINLNDWLAAGGGYIDGYCLANYSYTSGSTSTANVTSSTTWTSQGNYGSISGNRFTVPSRGTTIGNDRYNYIYASYGGKSASFNTGNLANSRWASSSSGGVTTYGNVTAGAISNKTIPASGGSATATAGNGSQSWSKSAVVTKYTYTSGSTKDETTTAASSGTNAVAPNVSSYTASASSKGTTVSSTTTVGSKAVTWSANGKSASGTMYIYQQANTKTELPISKYLRPWGGEMSNYGMVINGVKYGTPLPRKLKLGDVIGIYYTSGDSFVRYDTGNKYYDIFNFNKIEKTNNIFFRYREIEWDYDSTERCLVRGDVLSYGHEDEAATNGHLPTGSETILWNYVYDAEFSWEDPNTGESGRFSGGIDFFMDVYIR